MHVIQVLNKINIFVFSCKLFKKNFLGMFRFKKIIVIKKKGVSNKITITIVLDKIIS